MLGWSQLSRNAEKLREIHQSVLSRQRRGMSWVSYKQKYLWYLRAAL